MKLARFIGLFALSYFLLIFVYVMVAAIMAFYEQAPPANRVVVLASILSESGLSIFRDSLRWIPGSHELYSIVPPLVLINSTDGFRSVGPHILVQLLAFSFIGSFAAVRGCSLTMALLLPVALLGLTFSLLEARLLFLAYHTLTNICAVVGSQFIGLFLGSSFHTMRLR
ncbi:MAG: hypothetical protein RL417_2003 [Pseudomonadota bacterium]